MAMLSEQELLQICRGYKIECPVCGAENEYFRLKRDMWRAAKTEGDGHPLVHKWRKPGFDSVDPKQFFFGVCTRCRFTGDLGDPDFRQAAKLGDDYRARFDGDALRALVVASTSGKGVGQSLGKRIRKDDAFGSVLAQFHLGILSECLCLRIVHNNMARYYLRIGWLFRDQSQFYPDTDVAAVTERFSRLTKRWNREVPANKEHPVKPGIVLNELDALRLSRAYFERNYEMLREAAVGDELRLRQLLAEIGYRIYELSSEEEDFRKAASFYSGAMQQCLSIMSDKSIVGGAVNRAKEMLEICGERGRELRELYHERGGTDGGAANSNTVNKKASAKKASAKKAGAKRPKAKQEAAAADGDQAEQAPAPGRADARRLDQATRQAAVLNAEVKELRGRVKTLEDDNKKWRQLAGRDSVTGLPNKTMLHRIVLPKALRDMAEIGPVTCIAVGLDRIAEVNEGHGWATGDRMLRESAKSMRQFVQEGEELYRLDGVHFALVGPIGMNGAKQRAADMRRRLAKASVAIGESLFPLVSSLGVVSVEQLISKSPGESAGSVLEAVLETLYRAKAKGGNSVEICSTTRF